VPQHRPALLQQVWREPPWRLGDHTTVLASKKPLPRIICVCDEYFALIAQSKEEGRLIEAAVAMLGAKARAAGIHLVLAT
jgi:hypothetical protein